VTYSRPFPAARYCFQSGRTSIGRPPHSLHLRRQRSVGISIEFGQPKASTIASRPHPHFTSIDVMPNARILPRVIVGPVYESRMTHCRPPISAALPNTRSTNKTGLSSDRPRTYRRPIALPHFEYLQCALSRCYGGIRGMCPARRANKSCRDKPVRALTVGSLSIMCITINPPCANSDRMRRKIIGRFGRSNSDTCAL
jgi:hypothetical protein